MVALCPIYLYAFAVGSSRNRNSVSFTCMLFSRCNVTPEYKVTLWGLELRGHLFTTVPGVELHTHALFNAKHRFAAYFANGMGKIWPWKYKTAPPSCVDIVWLKSTCWSSWDCYVYIVNDDCCPKKCASEFVYCVCVCVCALLFKSFSLQIDCFITGCGLTAGLYSSGTKFVLLALPVCCLGVI